MNLEGQVSGRVFNEMRIWTFRNHPLVLFSFNMDFELGALPFSGRGLGITGEIKLCCSRLLLVTTISPLHGFNF